MTREEWQALWTSYYAFLAIATRVGFYRLFVKSYGENFLKNFMRSWIGELGGLCCLAGI